MGEGNKTETKSRAIMRSVEERIQRSACRYRVARDALLQLDPAGSWQGLYRSLEDKDNRGPGKEPDEAIASDGRYVPSWIWLSGTNATDPTESAVTPEEVNEDMRVEWAQCVACADRWEEEVLLLQEEMRRVVHFLEWKSKDWTSRVDARAGIVAAEVSLGLSAYAHKQAFVFHNLAIRFCQRWCSNLASLSLPHTWATDFLGAQKATLDNPDVSKCKPKRQECNPPGSLPTPSPEHLITTAAVTPSITTDPEINNDSSNPSDDNFYGSSSDSEESESEYWSD